MKAKSTSCGKGGCPHYDNENHVSKCKIYNDRSECSISNKQRRKSANHSKRMAQKFIP